MFIKSLAALCAGVLCIALLPATGRAASGSPAAAPASAEKPAPAAAGAAAAAPESGEEQFLDLVSAYQSGYLQVVAVSCYQLYAGAGLVEGAYRAKQIDGPTALEVLGQNSLLHSVCYTTLVQVQQLTPPTDEAAMGEISRLGQILETENLLLTALSDFFATPSDANSKAVDTARTQVEATLQKYADSGETAPGQSAPAAPAEK